VARGRNTRSRRSATRSFAFAGVWRPTGSGKAYAFLTRQPIPLVAPTYENAMPIILHSEDYDNWPGAYMSACAPAQLCSNQLMQAA
jgi:putative SOS response-associated peptidase YedK